MLIAIWAQDNNHLIGKGKRLPWRLPNDLKFFKKQTQGHAILMGRKTFDSLGQKPLPNRYNFVLTKSNHLYQNQENLMFISDYKEILEKAKEEDIFVIGGKAIYESLWQYFDELRITKINADFEGDIYFNPDLSQFTCYHSQQGCVDDKNLYPHTFTYWKRR